MAGLGDLVLAFAGGAAGVVNDEAKAARDSDLRMKERMEELKASQRIKMAETQYTTAHNQWSVQDKDWREFQANGGNSTEGSVWWARKQGMPEPQIQKMLEAGALPTPTLRDPGKAPLFTGADLEGMKKQKASRPAARKVAKLFNLSERVDTFAQTEKLTNKALIPATEQETREVPVTTSGMSQQEFARFLKSDRQPIPSTEPKEVLVDGASAFASFDGELRSWIVNGKPISNDRIRPLPKEVADKGTQTTIMDADAQDPSSTATRAIIRPNGKIESVDANGEPTGKFLPPNWVTVPMRQEGAPAGTSQQINDSIKAARDHTKAATTMVRAVARNLKAINASPDATAWAVPEALKFVDNVSTELASVGRLWNETELGKMFQRDRDKIIDDDSIWSPSVIEGTDETILNNAEFRSNITMMAYAQLGMMGQTGTAVSTQEFVDTVKGLAGNISNPSIVRSKMLRLLDRIDISTDDLHNLETPASHRERVRAEFDPEEIKKLTAETRKTFGIDRDRSSKTSTEKKFVPPTQEQVKNASPQQRKAWIQQQYNAMTIEQQREQRQKWINAGRSDIARAVAGQKWTLSEGE